MRRTSVAFLGALVLCAGSAAGKPPQGPLGRAPHRAGSLACEGVPTGPTGRAIIYYPSKEGGKGAKVASGRFPLIVFGQAKRMPETALGPTCPKGAKISNADDYRDYGPLLKRLARFGFIVIAPDTHYPKVVAPNPGPLADALRFMLAEDGRRGSLFHGHVKRSAVGAIGHSSNGGSVASLAGASPVAPKALAFVAPAQGSLSGNDFKAALGGAAVLVFAGTLDSSDYGARHAEPSYFNAAGAHRYYVKIIGGNHFDYAASMCIEPAEPTATISRREQTRIASAFLVVFFERHLLGKGGGRADYLSGRKRIPGTPPGSYIAGPP